MRTAKVHNHAVFPESSPFTPCLHQRETPDQAPLWKDVHAYLEVFLDKIPFFALGGSYHYNGDTRIYLLAVPN